LPSNQKAISDNMGLPVLHFRITGAVLLEHILNQKGDDIGQSDCCLFGIRETSYFHALYNRCSIECFGMAQDTRCVTNSDDWFLCCKHRFD